MEINIYSEISTNDKFLRIAIHRAFDGKCFYTGRLVSLSDMHIDHINPLSNGGKNCISNYVLSCSYINLKKNGKASFDFINVTTKLNELVFCDLVLKEFCVLSINDELLSSNGITENHVEISQYLKERGKYERLYNLIKNNALSNNLAVKSKFSTLKNNESKKNKLFILKEDADILIIKYELKLSKKMLH